MAGQNEAADTDKHEQSRDGHAVFVGAESLTARGMFVHQPFGNEDSIVVSLTKDEGGENDIDNIKLDAAYLHHA